MAEEPRFLPTAQFDVRAVVGGTVDRVLVREGSVVTPGAPFADTNETNIDSALVGRARAVLAILVGLVRIPGAVVGRFVDVLHPS